MIKDQFLPICPLDVQQFIKDCDPKIANQATEVADSYTANRIPEE